MKRNRSTLALLLSLLMLMTMVPNMSWAQTVAGTEEMGDSGMLAMTDGTSLSDDNMPGAVFTGEANNLEVEVTADEGTFPAGTTMTVTAVNNDVVRDSVTDVVGESAGSIVAADITFYDANGIEIEPLREVHVALNHMLLGSDCSIVHIDNDGRAEKLNDVSYDKDNQTAELDSDRFSVYAVVEDGQTGENARLKVVFYNGETEIASMMVKKADTLEENADKYPKILYDPGDGELSSSELFRGWTLTENYNIDSETMDIEGVRDAVAQRFAETDNPVVDGEKFPVYAAIFKVITITYLDEEGTSLGTDNELLPRTAESTVYTINKAYTPGNAEQHFEGWTVAEGAANISGYTDGRVYENATEVTLTGSIKLSADAPYGNWLIYNENGKGATYNAPRFIQRGEVTSEPSLEMVRNGYVFAGWYTGAPDEVGGDPTGEAFVFGHEISTKTEIYAKWTPVSQAYYTVIIWKQNLAGDGYDFEESIRLQGTPGTTINTVSRQGSGDSAYARVNGVNKQYSGFHLNTDTFDIDKTIAAEGDTVVQIYYDRNEYTLQFQVSSGGRRPSWSTVKSITALYGQDIYTNFPISGYEGALWQSYGSSIYSDSNLVASLDTMPAESTVFHLYSSTGNQRYYVNYYVEALSTDTDTISYGGKWYTLYKSVQVNYSGTLLSTESEDFTDINGFTKYTSNPAYNSEGLASFDWNNTISLYYTRNTYQIIYMDGQYVDGDGRSVTETKTTFDPSGNITFNADISSYNEGGEDAFTPERTNYTFEGWYLDDACTTPAKFSRMPSNNLTVYAKWTLNQYRVFLHPNVPSSDTSLDWGTDTQAMNFRRSVGDKVSVPDGLRANYDLIGWYLDEACTQVFNADSYVLNDQSVTTEYDKTADMTDPMDKWGNGATTNADVDRNWITKKLDLYASWRARLDGAKGIGVTYDANGGSGAPTDNNLYLDKADAIAQGASAAPENQRFLYWVVQTWDENAGEDDEGAYVDAVDETSGDTIRVYPGNNFQVLKAYARVTDVVYDGDGKIIQATYTVQLRAEYGRLDPADDTHIYWYANNGTDDVIKTNTLIVGETTSEVERLQINQAVQIKPAGTFSYSRHEFLGWARVYADSDANPVDSEGNAIDTASLTEDDLFLKYDAGEGSFYAKDSGGNFTVKVTQVAADESLPYHDLYAVWKYSEFYVVHSGIDGAVDSRETIAMDGNPETDSRWSDDGATFDLTTGLTANTLYGGYVQVGGSEDAADYLTVLDTKYNGDNWTWTLSKMGITPGGAIDPQPGYTYYIKEVPNSYLVPKTFTYYGLNSKVIYQMYMLTAIDDNNYSAVGFDVTGSDETDPTAHPGAMSETITIKHLVETEDRTYEFSQDNANDITLTSKSVIGYPEGDDKYEDFLTVAQLSKDYEDSVSVLSSGVSFVPYWVTPDGMKVMSAKTRAVTPQEGNKYARTIFEDTEFEGDPVSVYKTATESEGTGEAVREMRVVDNIVLGIDDPDSLLEEETEEVVSVAMYRLYNPNSGEHFYTASAEEKDGLVEEGWNYEDIAWYAPEVSDTPVYRLYNANAGDHHYTIDAAERDALIEAGWTDEGIGWYSDDAQSVPLYRLYNPNAYANGESGAHHYTTSAEEQAGLIDLGWQDEGVAWYGLEVNA